jgi:hypothetical protein
MPYNNVLHVSVYQNHQRAHFVYKGLKSMYIGYMQHVAEILKTFIIEGFIRQTDFLVKLGEGIRTTDLSFYKP